MYEHKKESCPLKHQEDLVDKENSSEAEARGSTNDQLQRSTFDRKFWRIMGHGC